jgi:hypothetical protein
MDGRAPPGERSINIVRENTPKVLEGWGQQGTGAGPRILPFLVMGSNAPGGQRAPPPFAVTETEHGNPVRLPQGKAHRQGSRRAGGLGRMEEANATLSWGGEGVSARATSPHAPAG